MLTSHLVAHRGLHDAVTPENSLAAFAAAVDAGYAIELDVHLTLEGELVVFHDHTLTRMCQRSETIERLTRRVRKLTRLSATDQHIPTLQEVLELVAGRVPVYVEVKARNSYSQLRRGTWLSTTEAVGKVLETYAGPVGVMSWDPRILRWFKEHMPQVVRVQSGGVVTEVQLIPGLAGIFDDLRLNRFSDPHAISFNALRLPRPAVSHARRSGLPVLAWTIHSEEALERIWPYADTVIFEGFRPASPVPERAVAAFEPQRDWLHRLLRRLFVWWFAWKEMSYSERVATVLTIVTALTVAWLVDDPQHRLVSFVAPAAMAAAALFAAWQPRRWVLIGFLTALWIPLSGLLDGKSLIFAPALALVGAALGAVVRTIRPPGDLH